MKRIIIVSFFMVTGYFAFGQRRVNNDPSYSINNYKHPNKAAYAKKHGFDRITTLTPVSVALNENYKQPHSDVKNTKKYAMTTSGGMKKSNSSYKHPYGL